MRLALLQATLTCRQSAAELAGSDGFGTTGQLYHHIGQLVAAGWLRPAERGRFSVPPDRIVPLLAIQTAAKGGS